MNDLRKIDGLSRQVQDCVMIAYKKGYKDGFADGKQAIFEQKELLDSIIDFVKEKISDEV